MMVVTSSVERVITGANGVVLSGHFVCAPFPSRALQPEYVGAYVNTEYISLHGGGDKQANRLINYINN